MLLEVRIVWRGHDEQRLQGPLERWPLLLSWSGCWLYKCAQFVKTAVYIWSVNLSVHRKFTLKR